MTLYRCECGAEFEVPPSRATGRALHLCDHLQTLLREAVDEASATAWLRYGTAWPVRSLPRPIDPSLATFPIQVDQMAHDSHPDDCWRCDATAAEDDLGLCSACREALTGETGEGIRLERRGQPDPAEIYRRAQESDPWPGPDYEGTSLLASTRRLLP